jgi:hypothetical protein
MQISLASTLNKNAFPLKVFLGPSGPWKNPRKPLKTPHADAAEEHSL